MYWHAWTFENRRSASFCAWLDHLPSLPLLAQEVTRLALRVDSSSLRRNNCYCLHSRGCCVAQSRAGAPGGKQSRSLFRGEPKTEPGTGPRNSRLLRGHRTHPNMCMCEHMLTYGSVCVFSVSFFLAHQSPSTPTHQLAVTELSMKCSGSDLIRQPVSLASAAFLSEGKQSAALVNCDAPFTSQNQSPGGDPCRWQKISWSCGNRSPGCVKRLKYPKRFSHWCCLRLTPHTFWVVLVFFIAAMYGEKFRKQRPSREHGDTKVYASAKKESSSKWAGECLFALMCALCRRWRLLLSLAEGWLWRKNQGTVWETARRSSFICQWQSERIGSRATAERRGLAALSVEKCFVVSKAAAVLINLRRPLVFRIRISFELVDGVEPCRSHNMLIFVSGRHALVLYCDYGNNLIFQSIVLFFNL